MTSGSHSKLFEDLSRELMQNGLSVRFQARGASMSPRIRDGEIVHVAPVIVSKLRTGDIVLTNSDHSFRMHRLVVADHEKDFFITRGDCGLQDDPAVRGDEILGVAEAKEVRVGRKIVRAKLRGTGGHMVQRAARGQVILKRLWSAWHQRAISSKPSRNALPILMGIAGLILWPLAVTHANAQVAVHASTSRTAPDYRNRHLQTHHHRYGKGLLPVGRFVSVRVASDT
jgi:hypothetical protein